MKRLVLLLGIACVCVMAGSACRKRGTSSAPAPGPAAPPAADGSVAANTFAAPPPPPPDAPQPVNESVQFYPPQPVNMYAPARPGDYQAQLDTYNRVLRKWTQSQSIVPNDLTHLMGIYNSPKPPQPPAGRRLVFDRKTVTVSLQ